MLDGPDSVRELRGEIGDAEDEHRIDCIRELDGSDSVREQMGEVGDAGDEYRIDCIRGSQDEAAIVEDIEHVVAVEGIDGPQDVRNGDREYDGGET